MEEPVDVEGGTEYYPDSVTTRAIRQGDRLLKRRSRLHRVRSYNRRGNGHVYDVVEASRFRNDVKVMRKRGADMAELEAAIDIIASGQRLPSSFKDHFLQGTYNGNRGCHIRPDWLFIYRLEEDTMILLAVRMGTCSYPGCTRSRRTVSPGSRGYRSSAIERL